MPTVTERLDKYVRQILGEPDPWAEPDADWESPDPPCILGCLCEQCKRLDAEELRLTEAQPEACVLASVLGPLGRGAA